MAMVSGPAAMVVIPTHDHASTLDLAVASALEQTVADMRIGMSAAARRDELAGWWARLHDPGFAAWWDDAVDRAVRRVAVDLFLSRER